MPPYILFMTFIGLLVFLIATVIIGFLVFYISEKKVKDVDAFKDRIISSHGRNGKVYGKILEVKSPTEMTVRWYTKFEWFFISKWIWIRSIFA